ncbi:MAG: glycosyltransferase family 4 protein [Clostridia bacterium]|nr:glycosyltransferase family 4 protein [Clostridia bacterium]
MKIWLINHYAVPPQYYPLARQKNFAKYLMRMGHEVTIFAASTVHNSDLNLITDKSEIREMTDDGVRYVLIRCRGYQGNGISRVINMLEFAMKLPGICKRYDRPDAIVATSMPPMPCAMGIRLSKKYKCTGVAEIADLWPESLIEYGIAGPKNPVVLILRRLEKWIYKKADSIVFTMGGGYDYIVEQHWEKSIPRDKVFFINNGVDLEAFDENVVKYSFPDEDLDDPDTYKIVYTGSLRKANEQIFALMDAIKLMQGAEFENYRFLIYGKGDYEDRLRNICRENGYSNVRIKGFVEKKYIPYILSKCDLNILDCKDNDVLRFGGSQNKLFDYLASGHPVISGESNKYSVVRNDNCGISEAFSDPREIVEAIQTLKSNPISPEHIRSVAENYDFKYLTERLLEVIQRSKTSE